MGFDSLVFRTRQAAQPDKNLLTTGLQMKNKWASTTSSS
jgi:hypothetical protein